MNGFGKLMRREAVLKHVLPNAIPD